MQEGCAFQSDINKGCTHAWQYVFDDAFVDVAYGVLLVFALYKELYKPVFFQNGYPLFQRMHVYHYLSVQIVFFHLIPLWQASVACEKSLIQFVRQIVEPLPSLESGDQLFGQFFRAKFLPCKHCCDGAVG